MPGRLLSGGSKPSQESYETGEVDMQVRLSSSLATAYALLSMAWLILRKVPASRRGPRVADWLEDAKRRRLVARKLLGKVNEEWLADEFGGIDPLRFGQRGSGETASPLGNQDYRGVRQQDVVTAIRGHIGF